MNLDGIATKFLAVIGTTLILTTVLGRRTTAPVVNAFGDAISKMMSAALGKGVNLQ